MTSSLYVKGEILKLRYDEYGLYEVMPQLKTEFESALMGVKEAETLFKNNTDNSSICMEALRKANVSVRGFMNYVARNENGNYALTLAKYKSQGMKMYSDIEILIKRFSNIEASVSPHIGACPERECISVTDIQFILGLNKIMLEYIYKIEIENNR